MDRPSLLKAHEAIGCIKAAAIARQSKGKKKNNKTGVSKRKRLSSFSSEHCSDESFFSNAFSVMQTESYNNY
jgi:hypothetical protein